ncbi:hypothetical protein LC1Hm_1329 [Halomicrobium sp. LC1Hm]|nr:hypothetical protein LC1Hm_1329 [Halomicrobium sp. LC1Hm]
MRSIRRGTGRKEKVANTAGRRRAAENGTMWRYVSFPIGLSSVSPLFRSRPLAKSDER